jgi:hypothetical protein
MYSTERRQAKYKNYNRKSKTKKKKKMSNTDPPKKLGVKQGAQIQSSKCLNNRQQNG